MGISESYGKTNAKSYAAESYDEWDNKDDDKWGAQAWGKDRDLAAASSHANAASDADWNNGSQAGYGQAAYAGEQKGYGAAYGNQGSSYGSGYGNGYGSGHGSQGSSYGAKDSYGKSYGGYGAAAQQSYAAADDKDASQSHGA